MPEPAITGLTPGPTTTVTAQAPFSADYHIAPQLDVIDLLPPPAQDRLWKLRDRSNDMHRVMVSHGELQEANSLKQEAERVLRKLTDHPSRRGHHLPPEDRRTIEAHRTLAEAIANLRRLTERSESRAAAWQAASQALAAVENWLRFGRPQGCVLEAIEVEPPKLLKGEGLVDAVERLRRRGRELKANLNRVNSAPFPSSWAKQRAREQVEAFAQRGAISVSRLLEVDGDIEFPTLQMRATVHNASASAIAFHEAVDVAGLIAFLQKPALIAALDREIDAEADDAAALTHEARQKVESEIMGDLLDVERQEAAAVWAAQARELPAEHRGDCDARAILQVQLIAAPRAAALPTSPEHGISFARPSL